MNEDRKLIFTYAGFNEYTFQNFLNFSCLEHKCKINRLDDLMELSKLNQSWFKNEYNYHKSLVNISRFVGDFKKFGEQKQNDLLCIKVKEKIELIDNLLKERQEKYFSLLFEVFLNLFSEKQKLFRELYTIEYQELVTYIFNNSKYYKKVINDFDKNFQNLIRYLFYINEEVSFLYIDSKILSRKTIMCFCNLAKEKIRNKLKVIKTNKIFFKSSFLHLLNYIWKNNSQDKEWFKQTLKTILENENEFNPYIFFLIIDTIQNDFRSKEIKEFINFDANYFDLKERTLMKLPFFKSSLPLDRKGYQFYKMCIPLLKKEQAFINQKQLMFIFSKISKDLKVINILTDGFGQIDSTTYEDFLSVLLREDTYNGEIYSGPLGRTDYFINLLYMTFFFKNKRFVINYLNNLVYILDDIFNWLNVPKKEQGKFVFFLEKIEELLLEDDIFNSLKLNYDLANHTINLIEYVLLITYKLNPLSYKNNKMQSFNFNSKNKEKLSFLIKTKGVKGNQRKINPNNYLSNNSLDFVYFSLYASLPEGGLDFRNKFMHNDWDFSDLGWIPIRLLFLLFSLIEEIDQKIYLSKIKLNLL